MPALTEWLNLMLAEIARKREDAERARSEEAQRATEQKTSVQRTDAAPTPRSRTAP
jgi:hypothetical protein